MDNEKLLQDMRELKIDIEYENNNNINNIENNENIKITVKNITFEGKIEIINPQTKQEETKSIYRIQKEVGDKKCIEFYADNEIIATVLEKENQIVISPKYAHIISVEIFLVKLQELRVQNKEQISLDKLEEIEKEREIGLGQNKKETKKRDNDKAKEKDDTKSQDKDNEKDKSKQNHKSYIEISMSQYITVDKTIADLIPEIKEKHCQKVMIRSSNNINFEMYGIDKDGNEVELKSLSQTEGTNPYQEMIKTNTDGTKVERTRVSTMLRIKPGTNEQKGNEGIGIKIGEMGIEEVVYYRRDQNDKYLAVPVGLETTNDKYSSREVREIATKRYNETINNNVEKAEERTKNGNTTTIENIDNNKTNDTTDRTEEAMLKKAAEQRCGGMSVEAFRQVYEKAEGNTIQEKIDNAVDTIDEEFGERRRR